MPPRPLPDRARRSRVLALGTVAGVALSAALVWSVVRFAAENPEKANLGASVFRVGKAERLARQVDAGGPFLFQDPLARGRGRNLYVQHLGDDPDTGWLAVEARLPEARECAVRWDRDEGGFVDCRDGRHGPDGQGLATYPATVTGGVLHVDLRGATSATTVTAPATAPTTAPTAPPAAP